MRSVRTFVQEGPRITMTALPGSATPAWIAVAVAVALGWTDATTVSTASASVSPTPEAGDVVDAFRAAAAEGNVDALMQWADPAAGGGSDVEGLEAAFGGDASEVLGRPLRVSGEVEVGSVRRLCWLTTDDDDPPWTWSLALVFDPDLGWWIRGIDGYNVALGFAAGDADSGLSPVAAAMARVETALAEGRFGDAFDAAVEAWEAGGSFDATVGGVVARWAHAIERGDGDWSPLEARITRLYDEARDDLRPVKWRMYPNRSYPFPREVRMASIYHSTLARIGAARGDSEAVANHRLQAAADLLQAYPFARDRAARVYLVDQAASSLAALRRDAPDYLKTREGRQLQANVLRNARQLVPRPKAPPRVRGQPRPPRPPARTAAEVYTIIRGEVARLTQGKAPPPTAKGSR